MNQWFEGEIHNITLHSFTILPNTKTKTTKLGQGAKRQGQGFCDCDDSGVRTHSDEKVCQALYICIK